MSKIKDTIEENTNEHHEYKFDSEMHAHTYCDKPLLGTSTVVGVIAKPLTWWAAGLAVAKFGWINKGNAKIGWASKEQRLQSIANFRVGSDNLTDEEWLSLCDEAYAAHSKKLNDSAKQGTDLHAELESYVRGHMGLEDRRIDYDEKILPFIQWAEEEVDKFLWSEIHCYSNKLWVGGISDCGVLLKNGKIGIIDFKSSKESYESQFIQCAGYDIQIQENGGFTNNGYKIFELEKPIEFYAIVPFGAPEFTIDFRYNVEELREGFAAAVTLYKLNNK